MGTDFRFNVNGYNGLCTSDSEGVAAAVTSQQVDADKNIYFIQLGINPHNRTPVGCAIDHSSIDWTAYDLTGGFGTYAEISYDANSFNGINYFKTADNSTPLGPQNTCGTAYVASQSTNPGGYNNSFSFLA